MPIKQEQVVALLGLRKLKIYPVTTSTSQLILIQISVPFPLTYLDFLNWNSYENDAEYLNFNFEVKIIKCIIQIQVVVSWFNKDNLERNSGHLEKERRGYMPESRKFNYLNGDADNYSEFLLLCLFLNLKCI